MNNVQKRYFTAFVLLIILFAAAFFANIFIGSTSISPADTVKSFFGKNIENVSDILWKIRIPRALAAMLLGGALSLSGYLLQTFFHNPIAGPFVLGVSSGAKLTVAAAVIAASGFVRSVSYDNCGICRLYDLIGICACCFKKNEADVNACCMWNYDWLYLFGDN